MVRDHCVWSSRKNNGTIFSYILRFLTVCRWLKPRSSAHRQHWPRRGRTILIARYLLSRLHGVSAWWNSARTGFCYHLDHLVKSLIHLTRKSMIAWAQHDCELIQAKDILPNDEFVAYVRLRGSPSRLADWRDHSEGTTCEERYLWESIFLSSRRSMAILPPNRQTQSQHSTFSG